MADGRRTITPEELEVIIDKRLDGVPVREVARIINSMRGPDQPEISINTITTKYRAYLAARAKENRERNEERAAEIEEALRKNRIRCTNALTAALLVDDPKAAQWADAVRKSLVDEAKFTDHRGEPEHAGKVTGAQAKAVADTILKLADSVPAEHRAAFLANAATQLRNLG